MKKRRKGKNQRARILIVDDHPIVRERLSQLIDRETDLITCGEAEDAPQALRQITERKPDLAIVDLSLKETDGITLIKEIRGQFPRLPVLVLSMHDEALYAERSLRAGARGYITKQEATQKVLGAIRRVIEGEIYLSEKMSHHILEKIDKLPTDSEDPALGVLSDRELEVFRRVGMGHGTRQIAKAFQISSKTVETYRARIRRKLGITNNTQFLQEAMQWVQGRRER